MESSAQCLVGQSKLLVLCMRSPYVAAALGVFFGLFCFDCLVFSLHCHR